MAEQQLKSKQVETSKSHAIALANARWLKYGFGEFTRKAEGREGYHVMCCCCVSCLENQENHGTEVAVRTDQVPKDAGEWCDTIGRLQYEFERIDKLKYFALTYHSEQV
jgi:hypothetical protein